MNKYRAFTLLCTALCWTAPVAAQGTQNIYRCGDSYSQTPCAGGKLVAASDSRSPAQKAQTDEATKRVAKAGDAMEKARVKEEGKPVPVGMPAATPASAPKDVKTPAPKRKAKAKQPEFFTAAEPKKPGDESVKKKPKKNDS